MINLFQLLTGTRKFKIIPDYNSEFVKNRLIEEIGKRKFSYGLSIRSCSNDSFIARYKFGRGLDTTIRGRLKDDEIYIACRPSVYAIVFLLVFSLAQCIAGLFLISIGFDNWNLEPFKLSNNWPLGPTLLLFGIGFYIFFVCLFYLVHKPSVKKLTAWIGGGLLYSDNK